MKLRKKWKWVEESKRKEEEEMSGTAMIYEREQERKEKVHDRKGKKINHWE